MINPDDLPTIAARAMARCDRLAQFSEDPTQLTRVYLSEQHLQANQQVAEWMSAAGMSVWQDAVGNICGRYEAIQPGAPAILLGSHLDTVRNAGRYDGPLGVICAIELVDYLNCHQIRLPVAIEIVGFADEEGTRFGITLLGSKGLTSPWPEHYLATCDSVGVSVGQALQASGLEPEKLHQAIRATDDIIGYFELHIEQGPCLEHAGQALGVVTAINGARRLSCRFFGQAGHAGTVPMRQRQDALVGAAAWIMAVEAMTQQAGDGLVATVGTLNCQPGAVNVIPGSVELNLDIRGPQDEPLDALLEQLLAKAQSLAQARDLLFEAQEYYRIPATACDPRLQQACAEAVEQVQGQTLYLPSGAGHDAIAIAERWPVAMLFVRCAGGISHHPAESVNPEDVGVGIQAYLNTVLKVAEQHASQN